jgi:hypothetical protein
MVLNTEVKKNVKKLKRSRRKEGRKRVKKAGKWHF